MQKISRTSVLRLLAEEHVLQAIDLNYDFEQAVYLSAQTTIVEGEKHMKGGLYDKRKNAMDDSLS